MTSRIALTTLGAIAALVISTPGASAAQGYPFSQRGTVSQMVAFTELKVEYGRPVARGRVLFADSGLVPYGNIWHPGADSATHITISRDIQLEGRALKAGAYSLWLIPRGNAPWTLVISSAARVFHTPYPGADKDALRVDIAPVRVSHMESLAIYFNKVLRDDAEMRIHWGEWALPITIKAPYRPPELR
ncbi:MAG: DUF2911 domain-containing protein [Gemmatimonadota bacterium]|nr:DUF2911 domain-containing protein [Gemmatimonadota bacterium]